jgi:hypothetical protein
MIIGSRAIAHEDPRGDVRPKVVTTSDRFEVYFTNNRGTSSQIFRTTFTADGKLIADREPFNGETTQEQQSHPILMNLEGGRPRVTFTPLGTDRPQTFTPKLPPGEYTDCLIVDWLHDGKILMQDSPAKAARDDPWPFSLRTVDLFSDDLLYSAVIGTPARIYDIARTSPALHFGGEIIIAWMEMKQFPDSIISLSDGSSAAVRNATFRVVVTRWEPKLGRILHTLVAPAVSENVSISIGRINQVLLVAWHELGRIRTRTVDLSSRDFFPKLPELRQDSEIQKRVMDEILGRF